VVAVFDPSHSPLAIVYSQLFPYLIRGTQRPTICVRRGVDMEARRQTTMKKKRFFLRKIFRCRGKKLFRWQRISRNEEEMARIFDATLENCYHQV